MEVLQINGETVEPGQNRIIHLSAAKLYDHTDLKIPVRVIRGTKPGPTVFLSGAIHGDELNSVEIIRRVLSLTAMRRIAGSIIAVPIVNVFGFLSKSRYLPDRRDLNRAFPGSPSGSMAARLAHLFMSEVVEKCQYGIDLHPGAVHRSTLPQIRVKLGEEETRRIAGAFGAPVILDADLREGSLRSAAAARNVKVFVYEGGEALRFDEGAIRTGLNGVLGILHAIGVLEERDAPRQRKKKPPISIALSSYWLRAPQSGILHTSKKLGTMVEENEVLGFVSDPMGDNRSEVRARERGIIIGLLEMPLVSRGDALFNIATFKNPENVEENLERFQDIYY